MHPHIREDRRRRSRSRSPASRGDGAWESRHSPRHEGRTRVRSRSRSLTRKRRTSPSPPATDGREYAREHPSRPRQPSHYDHSQNGFEGADSSRGRGAGFIGSSQSYRYRPSESPHHRVNDSGGGTVPGGSSLMPTNRVFQYLESGNAIPNPQTEPNPSDPSTPAVPSGPASWRRAQQYKQERPYQQDYRPNVPLGRGASSMTTAHRLAHRPQFPSNPHSPVPSLHDSSGVTSSTLHRPIPTGPRALTRPSDPPAKKEYNSPVPELDQKVC